jgi:hypothetical protein
MTETLTDDRFEPGDLTPFAFEHRDGRPARPFDNEVESKPDADGNTTVTTPLLGLRLTAEGYAFMRANFVRTGGNPNALDHLLEEVPFSTYETFGEHWRRVHQAGPNWRAELDAIKDGLRVSTTNGEPGPGVPVVEREG